MENEVKENNQAPEEGLIYKKTSPKDAGFRGYMWLYFHTLFGTILAAMVFAPIGIALGVYLLLSSSDNPVWGIVLLIISGLLLLILLFVLLLLPLINASKSKHAIREKSYFAIYEDRVYFHYEYDEGLKADFAFKVSEILSGKEYKTRFFMKGKLNGKVSSFAISKDELDEKAIIKLRSLCK